MRAIGNFPILKFADSNNSAQFEINSSIVSVGRDKQSNVICIPNSNISRNHFSIVFENNEYRIQDNNSTNGIIVNGYKLKNVLLNNGDIIEIADVTFTFYK
jgi:pSer/pThr/pTyr-binding forkhead associated (FHA) protein